MANFLLDRIDPQQLEVLRRFTSETPVRVGALAMALGLKVTKAPLPAKISGVIQPCREAEGGFEIKVNKYEIPERQRFSVAHEISHYLLHKEYIKNGVVDNIMYRSNLSSTKEVEANKLAAEIIMPVALIKSEIKNYEGPKDQDFSEEMAHKFRVSEPAMRIRLGID